MHWNGKDSAVFQAQKEYIDTAVIPLIVIDGSEHGFAICCICSRFHIIFSQYN